MKWLLALSFLLCLFCLATCDCTNHVIFCSLCHVKKLPIGFINPLESSLTLASSKDALNGKRIVARLTWGNVINCSVMLGNAKVVFPCAKITLVAPDHIRPVSRVTNKFRHRRELEVIDTEFEFLNNLTLMHHKGKDLAEDVTLVTSKGKNYI